MKYSKVKIIFFLLFICSLFSQAQTSEYNLKFKNLSKGDKLLIDSITTLIEKSINDSIRINYVYYLAENTWGIDVWPKYNQVVYNIAMVKLKENPSNKYFLERD